MLLAGFLCLAAAVLLFVAKALPCGSGGSALQKSPGHC